MVDFDEMLINFVRDVLAFITVKVLTTRSTGKRKTLGKK